MNVVIRTDSSTAIGTGHVMRCLTLADQLDKRGAHVHFVCRDLPGSIVEQIRGRGYPVGCLAHAGDAIVSNQKSDEYAQWLVVSKRVDMVQTRRVLSELGKPCDWLIVDHYALDKEWESGLREVAGQIMAIDDLANREHDCDLLLDQSHSIRPEVRYEGLVSKHCQLLLGAQYALLRPEFAVERDRIERRNRHVRRVQIFFGGADPSNETARVLKAIRSLKIGLTSIDVIVGAANPRREEIKALCATSPRIRYHSNVDNMAELMAQADLAIGAGGTTTWERCCLGLPSLIIAVAENQVEIGEDADQLGVGIYLGREKQVTTSEITERITKLTKEPESIAEMSRRGMMLVDGLGATRVADCLTKTVCEGAIR